MTFAEPEWLLGLAAAPFVALSGWLAWRKRRKRWPRLVASRLRSRLVRLRPTWVHFTSLGLALAGWCGLVIAMAQPESGEEWVEVENEGRNILFCMDVSRSMLAEDVAPSRLAASRAAALEILEKFPNDRVGVLLFAGETLMQSPLTIDHSFVEQTLAQLDPDDIPYGGSNLAEAINAGTSLLAETGQQSNIMVVFSDGEKSTDGLSEAAERAAEAGVFIYALGMGTTDGTFIPDPRERDGRFRDRRGNVVFSQLDESALELLAQETDGHYSRGMGRDFLLELDTALAEMDRFREEGKYQRVAKPAHQWFVCGGIFLLMSSLLIRCLPLRPLVAASAFVIMASSSDAGPIEDGIAALQAGEPARAHLAFRTAAREATGSRAARLNLSAGSAATAAADWEAAVDSFGAALSSNDSGTQQKACYGLGTSLFYFGLPLEKEAKIKAWKGAINHFEASLELLPGDQATRENLAMVRQELNKLEEPPPSESDQDQKQEEKEDEKNQKDPEEEEPQDTPGKEDREENPKKENKDEDKQDQPGQENSEDADPKQSSKEGKGDQKQEPSPDQEGQQNPPKDPQEGEPRQQDDPDRQAEEPLEEDRNAPGNETPEDRARRLLKQYADFGGKAPRRTRRPFNRSAQDW